MRRSLSSASLGGALGSAAAGTAGGRIPWPTFAPEIARGKQLVRQRQRVRMVSVNRTASSNAGMKQRARPSKYATFEEDDRRNNLDGERKKLASFGGKLAN